MFACLARLAVIIAGYALACLAASIFLNFLGYASAGLVGREARDMAAASSLVSVPVLAVVISYFAFVPALAVVVIAEYLAWRDWLAYALAGGGTGLAVALFVRSEKGIGTVHIADPGALAAIAGAGMLAGIVYWMAAGRRAGRAAGKRAT